MITVRFPSGYSVQYNDLTWVSWVGGVGYLHKKKDTGWSVRVPEGALIEFVSPCRSYDGGTDATSEKLWELTRQVELLKKNVARLLRRPKP